MLLFSHFINKIIVFLSILFNITNNKDLVRVSLLHPEMDSQGVIIDTSDPAPQWFSSIEDPAMGVPGPLAIGTHSQAMSPTVTTLETNTAVTVIVADNSVPITEQVQGEPRRYHPADDIVRLAQDLQRMQSGTSGPASTSQSSESRRILAF